MPKRRPKATKIDEKSNPKNKRRADRKNLHFSAQREGEKAPKISLRQKLLKERDLENIDFSLVFAVFFAMAPLAEIAKIDTLECAARLEKRTESTQKNIGKIDKNRQN